MLCKPRGLFMKTVTFLAKNRNEVVRIANMRYGERYFILRIKEIIKKNIFGIPKVFFEVSINVLEQR